MTLRKDSLYSTQHIPTTIATVDRRAQLKVLVFQSSSSSNMQRMISCTDRLWRISCQWMDSQASPINHDELHVCMYPFIHSQPAVTLVSSFQSHQANDISHLSPKLLTFINPKEKSNLQYNLHLYTPNSPHLYSTPPKKVP